MSARPVSLRTLLPAGVILLAVLAAFHGSFSGPFVLDDEASIAANPTLRHLWPIGPVLSPPGRGATVSGRPVLNLSLAVNYALGGTAVGGYHALNLAIHLAAALTLFGIARRTFLQPILRERYWAAALPLALGVAVIWAVHPLQTESVTYVVQRAESLMGLFYLLTLYCFIRAVERVAESAEAWRRRIPNALAQPAMAPSALGTTRSTPFGGDPLWFSLSFAACLFGAATKEVMVSAPVIVFLYDRTFVAGTFREAWRRRGRFYLSLAATWVLLGFLVYSNGSRGGTSGFGLEVPWWKYELTQFGAIAHYLRLSVWPDPLIFDYGTEWVRDFWAVLPSAVLVLGLTAATVCALRKTGEQNVGRALGFAGAWFFAVLAPTSLVPGNRQTLAEHRMYLALAPVVALAVCGIYELIGLAFGRNLTAARRSVAALSIVCLVLVIGLGAATVRRNEDYRSGLILWSDTVAKRPLNPFAQNNLGDELQKAGRTEEAIGRFEEAVRLKPDSSEAHGYLGGVLVSAGRLPEALAQCREALRLSPSNAVAHSNLGYALAVSGRLPDAIIQYQEALLLKPDFAEADFNLSIALAEVGRLPEAIARCEQALRLRADFPEARAYLDRLRNGEKKL